METRHPVAAAVTALAVVLMVIAGGARADQALLEKLADPQVAYAADFSMTSGELSMTGRIHHAPGLTRAEFDTGGQKTVSIVDRAARHWLMVMPATRQYMEMALKGDMASAFLPPNVNRAQIRLAPLGTETLNGVATRKVRITHPLGSTVAWVTEDGITVKLDGTATMNGRQTKVAMRLTNLERGPQDPNLFKVPAGYTKIDMPGGR